MVVKVLWKEHENNYYILFYFCKILVQLMFDTNILKQFCYKHVMSTK